MEKFIRLLRLVIGSNVCTQSHRKWLHMCEHVLSRRRSVRRKVLPKIDVRNKICLGLLFAKRVWGSHGVESTWHCQIWEGLSFVSAPEIQPEWNVSLLTIIWLPQKTVVPEVYLRWDTICGFEMKSLQVFYMKSKKLGSVEEKLNVWEVPCPYPDLVEITGLDGTNTCGENN